MASFSTDFFGCYDNYGLCITSFFLPCYTVGRTAEAVGENCFVCGLGYLCGGCIVGAIIRQKVRQQKGIKGDLVKDILNHFFCPLCAIVQDNQEVIGNPLTEQSIERV